MSPDKFALEFFRAIEVAPVSEDMYENAFVWEFKQENTLDALRDFVKSTLSRFGIDGYDRPLEARLTRPPATRPVQGKTADTVEVTLHAFTARGQTQQRLEGRCENDSWKVIRFAYMPEK